MADVYFWRQLFILASGLLTSISIGFMLAFPVVLDAAILSNDTDIHATRDQASWISASNGFAGMFGSLIFGPILPVLGRKAAHIGMSLAVAIGFLIFPFAKSLTALYAARIVQGSSIGGIYIHSIIISEYIHPRRRGYFITVKKIGIATGCFCCHAMGTFWSWRQVAIFAAALPFMSSLLVMFWPESPSYLALKGRFADCKKSFKWLNGSSEESEKHLRELIEAQMENSSRNISCKILARKFLEKDFLKPLLIVSFVSVTLDLCGRYYFVAYATEIMMKLLNNKTSAIHFTLGADLMSVLALSASIFVIRTWKRRTILFVFGYTTVFLMLSISLLTYLNTIYMFRTEMLWFTAFIVIFLCFFINLGYVPVSFTIVGEVFPLEHKGLGSCCSGVIFTALYGVMLKLTPVLMTFTGLHGTFSIYGVTMAACLVLLYRIMPETKDKTLQDIENDIKGRKKSSVALIPKA